MTGSYDAVLLDLYDTLVWTEWPELRDRIARRLGVEQPALMRAFDVTRPARSVGEYEDAAGDMRALLGELGVTDEETIRDLVELERGFFTERPRVHLHPDSLPAVRELRARGAKVAIVSNCSRSTRAEVERLGLDAAVDAAVLSCEVRAMKPDPAIYRAALSELGAEPGRSLFVDDQTPYCDGARDLGIDTRLILRRGSNPAEGVSADADGHRVITSLADLIE